MRSLAEKTVGVRDICEKLKVHPVTVQRWLHSGRLKGTIDSRRSGWRVREDELERFVKENPEYNKDSFEAMMFQAARSRVCKDLLIGLHEMQKKFLVEGHGKVYSDGWNAAMNGFDKLIKETIVEI